MAIPDRRTRLLERVGAGRFGAKFTGAELQQFSDSQLAALAGDGGSAAADAETLDRRDLAVKLSRLYGFDLSAIEGMTLEQLREVARVMAARKQPDEDGDDTADTDGVAPEMTASEKEAVAKKYYERYRKELSRTGMAPEKFVETWKHASSKEVRGLQKELRRRKS